MEKLFSGLHRIFQTDLTQETLEREVQRVLDQKEFALTLNGKKYFIRLPYTQKALEIEIKPEHLRCNFKFYCQQPENAASVEISYSVFTNFSRHSSFIFGYVGQDRVERFALEGGVSHDKMLRIFNCPKGELDSVMTIPQLIDGVIKEKIENSFFDFSPLDTIKWKGLNPLEMYQRHLGMDAWRTFAEANLKVIQRDQPGLAIDVERLLSGLANKTSAKGILMQAEAISEKLDLPNPLVAFCTQNKRAGLLGIDHVTAITLIPLIPEGIRRSFNLVWNHFNCETVLDRHNLMLGWHNSFQNEIDQIKDGGRLKSIKGAFLGLKDSLRDSTDIKKIVSLAASLENNILNRRDSFWASEITGISMKPSFVLGKSDKSVNGLIHTLFIVFLSLNIKSM